MSRSLWPAAAALALCAGLGLGGGRERSSALSRLSELPVLHEGRIKPLESVARSTLLLLRGKQAISDGRRALTPMEWLLDALAAPDRADGYPVFRVDDPELLAAMGVREPAGRYYSYRALAGGWDALEQLARQANAVDARDRSRVETEAEHLHERLIVYQRLKNSVRPELARDFTALVSRRADSSPRAKAMPRRMIWAFMAEAALLRPLPPLAGASPDGWRSVGQALMDEPRQALHPLVLPWARLGDAWEQGDPLAFERAVDALSVLPYPGARRAAWEAAFDRAEPFTIGMALYLLAAALVLGSWLAGRPGLRSAGAAALTGALAVHSAGLLARMWIEGRPPVTNLYSSAVFVGWIAAFFGWGQERRAGDGVGAVAASSIGFATLIIAHHLSMQGDTMEMMRAVLDSNFWLATHVVTITAGYGAVLLAGTLAHVYVFRGFLDRSFDRTAGKRLADMTYFALSLGLFFSFLGTVLGGIWADQSWGRFWGWDPKENGALIIVLWLAAVLHARWGGLVRERGVMLMAVFGNVVTALSWFGVNMLGIGLHSYGFMEGEGRWLAAFLAAEAAVLVLGFGLGFREEAVVEVHRRPERGEGVERGEHRLAPQQRVEA